MFIFSYGEEIEYMRNVRFIDCEDCTGNVYKLYKISNVFKPFMVLKIPVKKSYILECTSCKVTYTIEKNELEDIEYC